MKAPLDARNAERLAAYQRKLREWRQAHQAEYYERLRRGLQVRAKWRRLWERRERAESAPVLRWVSTQRTAGGVA